MTCFKTFAEKARNYGIAMQTQRPPRRAVSRSDYCWFRERTHRTKRGVRAALEFYTLSFNKP